MQLQLFRLTLMLGQERAENLFALLDPFLQLHLHVSSIQQSLQPLHLLLPQGRFARLVFFQILQSPFVAVRAVRGTLHRVLLHPVRQEWLIRAQFVAHAHAGLFLVAGTLHTRLLIENSNCWPASAARAEVPTDWIFTQIHVAKDDLVAPRKRLGNLVPLRRLLASSASATGVIDKI